MKRPVVRQLPVSRRGAGLAASALNPFRGGDFAFHYYEDVLVVRGHSEPVNLPNGKKGKKEFWESAVGV